MKRLASIIATIALLVPAQVFGGNQPRSKTALVTITGQTAGPTPFISNLLLSTSDIDLLMSIGFEIVPKPGSVTRPISASYTNGYLKSNDYLDSVTGKITLPIFGLYAGYNNTVKLTCQFSDGSSQHNDITVVTPVYGDPYGYGNPTVLQARTNATDLSYDYFLLKSYSGTESPIIMDTDGVVRWVGTSGQSYLASIFFENSFYVSYTPAGTKDATGIARMELDGRVRLLKDYRASGVTWTGHHNYDPGKNGILAELNTTTQTESVIIEIDTTGKILKSWNPADIISAAMTAGGDDPSKFVYPAPVDWFHNNAATYRKSDDSLVVSSRENFVICLDYQTGAIKWILGDDTKNWYQFPSLRKYALALSPGSLPPIGQHAVSFTQDDNLLLFDNGTNSAVQVPQGINRGYSAARKYTIDTGSMLATEVWHYPADQSIYSTFTSSIYEDAPSNYFIDYANVTIDGKPTYAEFAGLDSAGKEVFHYRYPAPTVGAFAWNGIPIHLENLAFGGPISAITDNHPSFFKDEVPLANDVYYLAFSGTGNLFGYYTYLSDPSYIYHFDLGYEYLIDAGNGQDGIYLYDFASQSFFYTSPSFPFPYLYDFSLDTVLCYLSDPSHPGSSAQRYFYNFKTGQIITK